MMQKLDSSDIEMVQVRMQIPFYLKDFMIFMMIVQTQFIMDLY
jgi:hypothetical protein